MAEVGHPFPVDLWRAGIVVDGDKRHTSGKFVAVRFAAPGETDRLSHRILGSGARLLYPLTSSRARESTSSPLNIAKACVGVVVVLRTETRSKPLAMSNWWRSVSLRLR